jgi:tRNA1(Val) A37 N6-methylase TrmN6
MLGGRLHVWQPRNGYRAATDPVLLAAFVPAREGERVLDLGCGVGTAGLCLARRVPGLEMHGLEIQPAYAELARRNALENGLAIAVHEGDLGAMPAALRRLNFDHVLLNPPYHETKGATPARDAGRDVANREGAAGLAAWIEAGIRRLKPGGRIAIIQRSARLGEILVAFGNGCGAVEVLPLAAREGRPADRVLVRARKAQRTALVLHYPLTLHQGRSHLRDGNDYTEQAESVLRDMKELAIGGILPNARLSGN